MTGLSKKIKTISAAAVSILLFAGIAAAPLSASVPDTDAIVTSVVPAPPLRANFAPGISPEPPLLPEDSPAVGLFETLKVRTLGDITFDSDCEPLAGETFSFSLTLGKDWVLRGIEILDSNKMPLDFDIEGIYKYSFVMPEGDVTILLRSEDHGISSRADAVFALWKLAGKPVVDYALLFADVDEETDYAEAVRWAASERIVSSGEFFRPEEPITREELAVIVYRYFIKAVGEDAIETDETCDFAAVDRESVSEWALDAVCWNVENEIMDEFSGASGYFKPQESLTRHELKDTISALGRILCTPPEN